VAHPHLTMTGFYNVLERLGEIEAGAPVPPLTDAERDTHNAGQIGVLRDLHDRIDRTLLSYMVETGMVRQDAGGGTPRFFVAK
jgi:hypothetical protein